MQIDIRIISKTGLVMASTTSQDNYTCERTAIICRGEPSHMEYELFGVVSEADISTELTSFAEGMMITIVAPSTGFLLLTPERPRRSPDYTGLRII